MFDAALKSELSESAEKHRIELAALLAVIEIESGGKLFAVIAGKKEPLIRFEGHYFYRLLTQAKRNRAVTLGLAHPKAGKVKNPIRQIHRWRLLSKAAEIDHYAAYCSTSWGCGQVMGSHWKWLGYGSIDALVLSARSGAGGQVDLMLRYIEKAGLTEKIVNRDWRGFARGYNGPAYARYGYHTKLAKAYLRHKRALKEEIGSVSSKRNSKLLIRFGDKGLLVTELQNKLSSLGIYTRSDGDFGPATLKSVKTFQRENRLKVDGIVGEKTFLALNKLTV